MNGLQTLTNEQVDIEISGNTFIKGILVDVGLDILVIFDGKQFIYIPMLHIHNIKKATEIEEEIIKSKDVPLDMEKISYRNILNTAKGQFVEIYVTGNKPVHGYVTNVLNDYFSFFSPVYKTILISFNHMKWLTPYKFDITPYKMPPHKLPVKPSNFPLLRNFEEQLKKYIGELVVFDMGDKSSKIGVLNSVKDNNAELITAESEHIFWKISHLKTMHLP